MAGKTTKKKPTQLADPTTEQKILAAARAIFHRKGYAATRTRDIAAESGINLALLNYYFRSKEKLFDLVMKQTMSEFLKSMAGVFNDRNTSITRKFELIANNYIELLKSEPDIPMFVLSELRNNPGELVARMNLKKILLKSYFVTQLTKEMKKHGKSGLNPLHFVMNLLALIVFPFLANPMIRSLGGLSQEEFMTLMEQRQKMIPLWVTAMLKTKK